MKTMKADVFPILLSVAAFQDYVAGPSADERADEAARPPASKPRSVSPCLRALRVDRPEGADGRAQRVATDSGADATRASFPSRSSACRVPPH